MGLRGKSVRHGGIAHRHVAQGVEKLDRRLEFFAEKFHHIRKADRAAAKQHPDRLAASLAGPVKTDRPGDLSVQARHGVADDLRHSRFGGVARFRIGSAEAHGALLHFQPFRQRYVLMEFLCNRSTDGGASDRDAPAESAVPLQKNEVGRSSTDVDDQRASGCFRIVEAEGVIDGHRGDIDDLGLQPSLCHRVGNLGKLVRLHGDQSDIPRPVPLAAHDLVVPNHFVDGKRHILLRLERDDRNDILRGGSRQLDDARDHRLGGPAELDRMFSAHPGVPEPPL